MPIWARLIFSLLGLAAICAGIQIFQKNLNARQWRTTKGKILDISVSGFDEDFISVKYEYTVRNIQYVGDRFNVSQGSVGGATEIVKHYRPGTMVNVLYDPQDPRSSALRRDPIFVPIFFVAVGAVILLFGLFFSF